MVAALRITAVTSSQRRGAGGKKKKSTTEERLFAPFGSPTRSTSTRVTQGQDTTCYRASCCCHLLKEIAQIIKWLPPLSDFTWAKHSTVRLVLADVGREGRR